MRRARVASGAMLAGIVVLCAGILAYRARGRRTLASRIQHVLPDELVERVGAVKRAVRG